MTIKTHGRMFTDNTVGITQIAVSDGTDGQALVTDGSGTLRFTGEGGTVYLNTDNGLNNPVGGESCGIMITEYTP